MDEEGGHIGVVRQIPHPPRQAAYSSPGSLVPHQEPAGWRAPSPYLPVAEIRLAAKARPQTTSSCFPAQGAWARWWLGHDSCRLAPGWPGTGPQPDFQCSERHKFGNGRGILQKMDTHQIRIPVGGGSFFRLLQREPGGHCIVVHLGPGHDPPAAAACRIPMEHSRAMASSSARSQDGFACFS